MFWNAEYIGTLHATPSFPRRVISIATDEDQKGDVVRLLRFGLNNSTGKNVPPVVKNVRPNGLRCESWWRETEVL